MESPRGFRRIFWRNFRWAPKGISNEFLEKFPKKSWRNFWGPPWGIPGKLLEEFFEELLLELQGTYRILGELLCNSWKYTQGTFLGVYGKPLKIKTRKSRRESCVTDGGLLGKLLKLISWKSWREFSYSVYAIISRKLMEEFPEKSWRDTTTNATGILEEPLKEFSWYSWESHGGIPRKLLEEFLENPRKMPE